MGFGVSGVGIGFRYQVQGLGGFPQNQRPRLGQTQNQDKSTVGLGRALRSSF